MASLRAAFGGIGLTTPFSYRAHVQPPRPAPVRKLISACADPEIGARGVHRVWTTENVDYSEEGQGITSSDGACPAAGRCGPEPTVNVALSPSSVMVGWSCAVAATVKVPRSSDIAECPFRCRVATCSSPYLRV